MGLKYTPKEMDDFFTIYSSGLLKAEFIKQLSSKPNVSKATATLLWQSFDKATENWFDDFFKFVLVKNTERLDNIDNM